MWLLVEKQVTQGQLFRNSLNLNRCSPDTEIFSKRRKIYSRLRGELEDDVKLRTYRPIPNLCINVLPRLLLWIVGAWMHLKARCMPCLPGPNYMSPATRLSEAIPTQSTPQVHTYRWHSQIETGWIQRNFFLLTHSQNLQFHSIGSQIVRDRGRGNWKYFLCPLFKWLGWLALFTPGGLVQMWLPSHSLPCSRPDDSTRPPEHCWVTHLVMFTGNSASSKHHPLGFKLHAITTGQVRQVQPNFL